MDQSFSAGKPTTFLVSVWKVKRGKILVIAVILVTSIGLFFIVAQRLGHISLWFFSAKTNNYPQNDDNNSSHASPQTAVEGGRIEQKYISLLGGLEDHVIWIRPSQSKAFNFTLENNRDETGLMTRFIEAAQVNNTRLSSVMITWSNASSISVDATPSNYYHQLHLSDGELKEMDLLIPNKGSVTFQNNGDRDEEIKLNLQLTYTAIYR